MTITYDATVRYQKTDEWARIEGDLVVIGISDYAQDQLSDIVYVETPEVGDRVEKGSECATIESVKAAAEIYAPLSGEVVATNEALVATPELLNQDPFGQAWLFKVAADDLSELDDLMDAAAYEAYNATREEH
ncbi:MAG: glycine cleavage system protein GcvH [Caldilineales bacterium]|nr:glycine cleavage system protein GcvH [Caldilineales bacterium]